MSTLFESSKFLFLNKHCLHRFMVGDNPESGLPALEIFVHSHSNSISLVLDIAGANAAGWNSLLVETGVYDAESGLPPAHKPTKIVPDVEAAVKRGIELALRAEKFE